MSCFTIGESIVYERGRMKTLRILFTLTALSLLAVLQVTPNPTLPAAQAAIVPANIDPRVLTATANGGHTSFLLILRAQADLSRATQLSTKADKGTFVFNALRATAARTQPAVRAALDALGLSYRAYYIVNAFAVENGTRDQIERLAARSDVARVESDAGVRMQLPVPTMPPGRAPSVATSTSWGVSKINAPAVWALGYKGQGIVYANADTGVQWNHPALLKHYRGWKSGVVNHNYNWWDAVHQDVSGDNANPCGFSLSVPCDDYGHGTHTLGTGIGDDGKGNKIGVAPGAKWIACRNMEDGVGRPSQYIECFQFFLAPWTLQGQNPRPALAADVISNSWTCPLGAPPDGEGCTPDSLKAAVSAERAAGIFVVASAGNDGGAGCASVDEPPAIYDAATTVGATDSNDNLASFSSLGPVTLDGSNRLKPDLSAPGVNVRSSYPNNQYANLSGTSMAAPHVAGAVALLWSARPALHGNVSATEQVLFNSAYRNVAAAGSCGGTSRNNIPNNLFGYGRLDVWAALKAPASR